MAPSFEEPTEKERAWIADMLRAAESMIHFFIPATENQTFNIQNVDRAFSNWLLIESVDRVAINLAINSVGVALGHFLVSGLGFRWVTVKDQSETELAVQTGPDAGNTLVYPIEAVLRLYERSERDGLLPLYAAMEKTITEMRKKNSSENN